MVRLAAPLSCPEKAQRQHVRYSFLSSPARPIIKEIASLIDLGSSAQLWIGLLFEATKRRYTSKKDVQGQGRR
jgi:hypothetical protein